MKKKIIWLHIIVAFGIQGAIAQQKRKIGDPLEHLPKNIEQLTHFGERADISPDCKSIAFLAANFGDAMVIDVKTRMIRCLTCNVPAAAFLRVMHLPNGDFILMGPDHFENVNISRLRDSELWYLKNERGAKPIKLDQKVSEGFAISKKEMKIVFTRVKPNVTGPVIRELVLADVDTSGAVPKLANRKAVFESAEQGCIIEAQDFYNNDKGLVFFCYVINGITSIMGLDIASGKASNLTNDPKLHTEPEGIFPDGKFLAAESDRQADWLGGTRRICQHRHLEVQVGWNGGKRYGTTHQFLMIMKETKQRTPWFLQMAGLWFFKPLNQVIHRLELDMVFCFIGLRNK